MSDPPSVTQRTLDVIGTEIQSRVVENGGIKVPYAYLLRNIQPKPVCARYSSNVDNHSRCTVAAKSLFTDTCEHF